MSSDRVVAYRKPVVDEGHGESELVQLLTMGLALWTMLTQVSCERVDDSGQVGSVGCCLQHGLWCNAKASRARSNGLFRFQSRCDGFIVGLHHTPRSTASSGHELVT